jgi:hypothetical protein
MRPHLTPWQTFALDKRARCAFYTADSTLSRSFDQISTDGLRPVWQRVLHLILNDRGSMLLPETMGMHPVLIGAVQLGIDKLLRGCQR